MMVPIYVVEVKWAGVLGSFCRNVSYIIKTVAKSKVVERHPILTMTAKISLSSPKKIRSAQPKNHRLTTGINETPWQLMRLKKTN